MVSVYLTSLICSIITSILWGLGYFYQSLLVKNVDKFTIQLLYGVSLTIINFISSIIYNQKSRMNFNRHYNIVDYNILNNKKYTLIYILSLTLASFVYLFGLQFTNQPKDLAIDDFNSNNNSIVLAKGAYVAISSCYPIFTLLFSYLFEPELEIDLYRSLIGIGFILVGITILSSK